MKQLNMQRTWPPIPGLEKHAGTDTIKFVFHKDTPKDRKSTYVREVCNIRPQKTDTHTKIHTADGNMKDYPGDVSTPTLDLTTMKLHVNSDI